MKHLAPAARAAATPDFAWRVTNATVTVSGARRALVDDVSLDIPARSLTVLVGPNGAGKSTLLRVLLGVQALAAGTVSFAGRPLTQWSARDRARQIAVVPQLETLAFPLRVDEYVRMGRYPLLRRFEAERAVDIDAVHAALADVHLDSLADRLMHSLSGGEQQRARLARAYAQDAHCLVLDEPTTALDVPHAMQLFAALSARVTRGHTVVCATHDVNLASRFAHTMILLRDGRVVAAGPPHAVLTTEVVSRAFGWPIDVAQIDPPGASSSPVPYLVPRDAATLRDAEPRRGAATVTR
jgi:iron complex transport system ATP-binding protein